MQRCIAILAGGRSRPSSRDRGIRRESARLLEAVVEVASRAADRVLVVGREPPRAGAPERVSFLLDDVQRKGPLAGLLAALRGAQANQIVLAACDMPGLTVETFAWLFDEAAQRELEDGLLVVNGALIEPLFSVYTRACVPKIARQLAGARNLMRDLIGVGRFAHVNAPPHIAAGLASLRALEPAVAGRAVVATPA